jgi:hypothetical protein
MIEQWQYYLVVPESVVAAADLVSSALNNPSGIRETFSQFPAVEHDEDLHPIPIQAEYWIASFLACDLATEGTPSREALRVALGASSALSSILWARCANPHHPDTPPEAVGIVVASNWAAFAPGDIVDWEAVIAAIASE